MIDPEKLQLQRDALRRRYEKYRLSLLREPRERKASSRRPEPYQIDRMSISWQSPGQGRRLV